MRLAASTGVRAGELWAIRRGRISLGLRQIEIAESLSEAHGQIQFKAPKTYERRTVSVLASLRPELEEHLAGLPDDPDALLFPSPEGGGPMRHSNFCHRYFKPAVRAGGLPEATRFHDLRHTYAALLIAEGAHPKAVQERMGHRSIQTTFNVYGHLLPKLQEEIDDQLDEAFRKGRSLASWREGTPRRGVVVELQRSRDDG